MLSEQKIKQAVPLEKPYKIYDAEGLYAIVQPTGALWWRYRYRFNGRDSSIALGVYPSVKLLDARKRRDDAKRLLLDGKDPGEVRRVDKGQDAKARANTFLVIAEEWLETMAKRLSPNTIVKYKWLLNTFLYPKLGDKPVGEITTAVLFETLKEIERQNMVSSAHGCKLRCAQIFRYARAKGIECISVTEEMKGGLLPVQHSHHPAITDPKKLAVLLRDIYAYEGKPVTKAALRLAPYLFVRPNELRHAEWSEIDLDAQQWVIPASKLKGKEAGEKQDLIVPLATQVVDTLQQLKKETGCYTYVFPNERGCVFAMSNATLTAALWKMGYADIQSWHGFRATARTILEERLKYDPKYPEMQLAHKVKDPNGRAYNRTAFLEQRIEMMQRWADYLDELRLSQ
jgi:integrase